MKKILTVALLAVTLLAFGCKKPEDSAPPNTGGSSTTGTGSGQPAPEGSGSTDANP